MRYPRHAYRRVRIAAPMRIAEGMESDVKLAGERVLPGLTLMDLNDNANQRHQETMSPAHIKHKLTPDDMENDNELSLYRSHHKTPSLEASTGSGYFYDDDFNETNHYIRDINNDSFYYSHEKVILRTRSDTCLYELDLSMSEKASSQGQSSCGYDAASSADLSLHSDQLSPVTSRESGAKLFSSDGTERHHLYSTDSLDHELSASVVGDDFNYGACCAKKENYMLAFDKSPVRYSDEDENAPYNDAWLSDATEDFDGRAPEDLAECDTDSECFGSDMGESAAGEIVYLEDYCSNDREPLLEMFASNASGALALDESRSDAKAIVERSDLWVKDLVESENQSNSLETPIVYDSGCKSASTPSTVPSITTGANSTLDDYGSEILGEIDHDLRTSAETDTSYAYDNIFFEAIQHPTAEAPSTSARANSAPVETAQLISYHEPLDLKSDGGLVTKPDCLLRRWGNTQDLNDLKKPPKLATFATIKRSQEDTLSQSMRTSQSLESLPSESTKSTKMTTWQQIKKTRAPQTTWKKICQMKEILKQEESFYSTTSKSVPNLSDMCTDPMAASTDVVKREKKTEENDPSKRHSFTLFEIFRRAKSEEDDLRMIPSPVYQKMFASLMRSAESERGFYLQSSLNTDLPEEDTRMSRSRGVQTSFQDDASQTKSVQTSIASNMRRYHSSLDISGRGQVSTMTRSNSESGIDRLDFKTSPSKHLSTSMLFSKGDLPDLSFLNRPWRAIPRVSNKSPRLDHRESDRDLGNQSMNSILVHKRHQQTAPRRLDNPSVRQLRSGSNVTSDETVDSSDDNMIPPQKPKRTFAFEQNHVQPEAIPLRRLVPRSRSSESEAYSSALEASSDSQHSGRNFALDNAGYCRKRTPQRALAPCYHHRSSSGSEESRDEYVSDVSRMSVDSESSHRSDSSTSRSGSGRPLKSILAKRRYRVASSSPPRRIRRHSTGYLDSYSDDGAPHSWDQHDHSIVHRAECECRHCVPPACPATTCCHVYRERRRHCRLSYPPCQAHRNGCCCHADGCDHGGDCYDDCRQSSSDESKKKTVSFSEDVRYHSPCSSPFASPKHHSLHSCRGKVHTERCACEQGVRAATVSGQRTCPRRQSESSSFDSAFESESPPREFLISPTKCLSQDHQEDLVQSDTSVLSKTDLIHDLYRSVEIIQQHFAGAVDMREKSHLGTSADCPKIGSLLLTQLCPALCNLLGNGLHLRVRSFFGQVKNSVWKLVEESAELGSTMPVLSDIVKEVRGQLYLRSSVAKFNAFVFGLVNAKALDHWIQLLRTQVKLIRKHYAADSLVYIFTTLRGRSLFNDTIKAVHPLASLPFRIECNFEYKYRQTFSDQSTPEGSLTRSLDSDGLPELLQKTDVRQYIQQAKSWIEGSKLSESAMDYLGQRFYSELGQYPEGKKANRWSLPPIETMISLANFFARSPTQRPSPSMEEFALYLARVNQSITPDENSDLKVEKILVNGDFVKNDETEMEVNTQEVEVRMPSYKQGYTDYQFENKFLRVDSEPTLNAATGGFAPKKRLSVPDALGSQAPANQKRWSIGTGLINMFDKLLLDQGKNLQSSTMSSQVDGAEQSTVSVGDSKLDLPKNMQKMDSPKNMQRTEQQMPEKAEDNGLEEDTPTPKASPVRTWKSVAESTGKVSPPPAVSQPQSLSGSAESSSGATPTSPLRTWKTVSASSDNSPVIYNNVEEDVNANSVASPVGEAAANLINDEAESREAVRPTNLLIRHFNAPRSTGTDTWQTKSLESRRQVAPAVQYLEALCHHAAADSEQLSFSKGDVMVVIKRFERDWYYCRHGNSTGLVHSICVRPVAEAEAGRRYSRDIC